MKTILKKWQMLLMLVLTLGITACSDDNGGNGDNGDDDGDNLSDILFENLPKAIQTAFGESEYKDWRVDDVDMLERVEMETMYVIEVEKSKQEFDLFYAEDGTLIKAVEDIDNNDYYQPNTVPEVLKNFINNNYPQATIVDIEIEKGITEIDILHDNKAKELHFNNANEWLYTTWDVIV